MKSPTKLSQKLLNWLIELLLTSFHPNNKAKAYSIIIC